MHPLSVGAHDYQRRLVTALLTEYDPLSIGRVAARQRTLVRRCPRTTGSGWLGRRGLPAEGHRQSRAHGRRPRQSGRARVSFPAAWMNRA